MITGRFLIGGSRYIMKRKRIAVLLAGVDREYQHALTSGMTRAAREADADLFIFNCQGQADGFVRNDRGERAIFSLPAVSDFDAAVVLLATIPTRICRDQIRDMILMEPDMPIVTIDVQFAQSVQLAFDDISSTKELTRHMLDVHGAKSFCVVTGPRGARVADARYKAVCEVLAERGIELPEDAVYDGSWVREGGQKAAEQFLNRKDGLPDVIICGNDDMAFGVVDTLQGKGYDVPGDVLVTGFDARREALGRGLTTIVRPVEGAGELAIQTLMKWMAEGRPEVDEIVLPTEIIYGESCGCASHNMRAKTSVRALSAESRLREKVLQQTVEFTTALASVATQREAGEHLTAFARSWEAREMHVCVDPDFFDAQEQQERETYPDEMMLLSGLSNGRELTQQRFATRKMLPLLEEERDEPLALVFAPLHYMNRNIGYITFDVTHVVSGMLPSLLLLVSSAMMSMSLRATVQEYTTRLERISSRDELTGLHNRRGMRQLIPPVFEAAKKEQKKFAVVCCDMDGLKTVNDSFGHQAGDQAICRLSRAIQVLEQDGLKCIHISGDEFLALGCVEQGCTAEQLLERLRGSIDALNENDPWLCDISASMGACVAVPDAGERLEEFILRADNSMYAEKHLHHRRLGRFADPSAYRLE